jgi:hypothetical protein
MNVLIGHEASGNTRRAFRALGYNAWSCDLRPAEDASEHHYECDIFEAIGDREWDLAIFHPTCTYLTIAAEWAYKDVQKKKIKPGTLIGAERRAAREEAVEHVKALMIAPIRHKAIENPVGVLSSRIRKPDQIIHPNQFGHDASKATCLWLTDLPPLQPTKIIQPRWVCCGKTLPEGVGKYGCPNCLGENKPLPRWANQTDGGQNRLPPSTDRWRLRSLTYPGISEAMAIQWGRYIQLMDDSINQRAAR